MPKLDGDIVQDLEDAGARQELAKAVVRAISDKTIAPLATIFLKVLSHEGLANAAPRGDPCKIIFQNCCN